MTEQDWAPEPWTWTEQEAGDAFIGDAEGNFVIPPTGGELLYKVVNYPRIMACVNACAGIPTECLERVEQGKSSITIKLTINGITYARVWEEENDADTDKGK